ncbi:MAG: nucleotidyltransferase family protein [Sphingomicrobium sp.]
MLGEASTEFRLIVDCCRRAFAGGRGERSCGHLLSAVDWGRFARLARFHRVQGLVWNALAERREALPDDVAVVLSSDARTIVATNLAIARECAELRDAFEGRGVPSLFLKGLTVAALAYRKPMLKMGWDIDVLVAEADVVEAAAELEARGYLRTIPDTDTDLSKWHGRRKESVWSRPEQALYIELHTRLADNRRLIPSIGIDSPRQEVAVADGITLPTLARDELFAYLCVHGASSLWFRLKWITDLAALLSHCSADEIERLCRRSQELGAGRAADQALLLADDLYGSLTDTGLADRLQQSRAARWLASAAFSQLVANTEGREPTATLLGTLAIHWTQLLLLPDAGFAAGEAYRQVRDSIA